MGLTLTPRAAGKLAEMVRRAKEAPPATLTRENDWLYQPGSVIQHVFVYDQTMYGPYQIGWWMEFNPASGDYDEFGDLCWIKPPGGTPLQPGQPYPAVRRGEWYADSYLVFVVIGGGSGGGGGGTEPVQVISRDPDGYYTARRLFDFDPATKTFRQFQPIKVVNLADTQ